MIHAALESGRVIKYTIDKMHYCNIVFMSSPRWQVGGGTSCFGADPVGAGVIIFLFDR